jgi:hypothetical protein
MGAIATLSKGCPAADSASLGRHVGSAMASGVGHSETSYAM